MNKRIIYIGLSLIMLFALISLSGCRSNSLSGVFVNENDSSEYLEFVDGWFILMSGGEFFTDGTYRLRGTNLALFFHGLNVEEQAIINRTRNNINLMGTNFVRQGIFDRESSGRESSGLSWWMWIIIIIVGLTIIANLSKGGSKKKD